MTKSSHKNSHSYAHHTIPSIMIGAFAFGLLVTFMVSSVIIFRQDQGVINSKKIELGKNSNQNPPPPSPRVEITPFVAVDPGFLYLQNDSKSDQNTLWMMQKSFSSPKNLNIKNIYKLFNFPQSNKSIYQLINSQSIYVYDFVNGKTKEVKEDSTESYSPVVSIYNQSISPDGRYLVYQLDFRSKSCDTQSFCATVDPYPNNKKGYYAYDFSKDTKTYLGDYFITNNWSSDSRFVYISEGSNYHDYNLAGGSFRINVNDGVAKTLDRSSEEYSSVTAYYIEEREIQNIFVGTVGNAQTKASIKYIVNKGRIQAVIDSQVFGDIPASLIISPSREKAIYTRKATDIDGKTFYEFVLIDFESLATKVIMQDKSGESLWKIGAFWYDDKNLVYYEANPFGSDTVKRKANIFNINIENNTINQITKDGYSHL